MANKLINESSPYLLQHAHNPVDWYPWGEEALTKAKKEDKPILVSIGYSACHWCHVMERESFEDTQTAALMNHSFVNIKIDREERPDLDHIYMDAVQTMTGSGGWPLNVFLTPEGKPFYGGTYFPPGPVHNRPSWKDVLFSIAKYFKEKRPEIETQSESITTHLKSSNTFGIRTYTALDESSHSMFNAENLDLIYKNLMSHADRQNGGFGLAPKFPQTFGIRFLLHYFYFTKKEDALEHACKSIEKMIRGGIYDQIGGGFARYSTDNFWLVPHFEKMLYDNALLIIVMAEAFQVTHKKEYAETIVQCMNFLQRDFMSFEYGWYAAFDADSEGEEGKYYIWTKKDVQSALGKDAETFCDYYGITENGNWEGSNIMHVAIEKQAFVRERQLDPEFLDNILQKGRKALLDLRYQREAPAKDDKILLSWNALMVEACCKAYGVLGIEDYKDLAVKSMTFILNKFTGDADNLYFHSYKNGVAKIPAFLDDYSYLVSALIQIQEITGEEQYLIEAKRITEWVLEHFGDEKNGFFYYTHKGQQDIVVRKKEIYDGAVPSGNSVMSLDLFYLGTLFNIPQWKEKAVNNLKEIGSLVIKYPVSFGLWATLFQAVAYDLPEIAIIGENLTSLRKDFLRTFIPYKVFQSTTRQNDQFPLLRNKPLSTAPLIFLCKDFTCQKPVTEIDELVLLLNSVHKFNN